MVAAEDEKVLGVFDLVGEEEADSFERLLASVDVVAEEEVVGFGRETAVLEQAQQVVVLSVDVTCVSETAPRSAPSSSEYSTQGRRPQRERTADFDRRLEFEQDGLVDKDLARLCAQELDLVLLQLHLLARSVSSDCAGERGRNELSVPSQTSGMGCSGRARARAQREPRSSLLTAKPCSHTLHLAASLRLAPSCKRSDPDESRGEGTRKRLFTAGPRPWPATIARASAQVPR